VPQCLSGFTAGVAVGREQHLQQRTRQDPVDRVRAACHGVGENRLSVEQLARHPRMLAALPGEQPRRRRPVSALAAYHTGSQAALGQLGQYLAGAMNRIHDQRGPVFEMRTPHPSREAHIFDVDIWVGVQPFPIPLRQCHQRLR
jgi:hypothetical protein